MSIKVFSITKGLFVLTMQPEPRFPGTLQKEIYFMYAKSTGGMLAVKSWAGEAQGINLRKCKIPKLPLK